MAEFIGMEKPFQLEKGHNEITGFLQRIMSGFLRLTGKKILKVDPRGLELLARRQSQKSLSF